MGSKRRIAKYILPIILKDRKPGQWYIEPFVGGANVIDKVEGPRIGFDINPYLISLLCMIRDGWIPPQDIFTREEWADIRDNKKKYHPALVGYVGIELSFGARWFNSYMIPEYKTKSEDRNRHMEGKRDVIKQKDKLKSCLFACRSYDKINLPKESCIIYCDPPYQGTTGYKTGEFNHDNFWQWCRDRVKDGHQVFISEYQAPDDFKCIWEKEQTTTIAAKSNYKKVVERLFVRSHF